MHTTPQPQCQPIPLIIASIAVMAMLYFAAMTYKESYGENGIFYAFMTFACLVVGATSLYAGKIETKG